MIKVKEYSGHIRNWEKLCNELQIDKSLSRERREEAILIKSYQKWKNDMANHIHGMFSFALWDEKEKKLFCVRDQFGTKPFYYYETSDGKLLYGTSIRKIMEQPGFVKELNVELLQIYMSLTYIAGEDTFFVGVKKLMPGRYLIWEEGKMTIERYWSPVFAPDENKTLEEWKKEIHETFKLIMTEIKTEDEYAESFLSSGVDSSYMLAMSDVEISNSCGYARLDEKIGELASQDIYQEDSVLAEKIAELVSREIFHGRNEAKEQAAKFILIPHIVEMLKQEEILDASKLVEQIGIWAKQVMEEKKNAKSGWKKKIDKLLRERIFAKFRLAKKVAMLLEREEKSDECRLAKKVATLLEREKKFDESRLAKQTAEQLGRKNSKCLVTPEEYFGIVPWVMRNMEQPLGDASAIAFALACREIAKKTKICYSGEGADEFFGGYYAYRNAERYGKNMKKSYVGNTNIMKENEKKRILKTYNKTVLPINLVKDIYEEIEGLDPLSKMLYIDMQTWLEGDIYYNVHNMGTAAGLEIRMPITDTRMFKISSQIPSRYKIDAKQNKVAFRTAASTVLPDEIAFRPKLGFLVPVRFWLADDRYNQDVRTKFNSEMAEQFFHVDQINAIFDEYINGNSDNWRKVWTIYTFLVWYEEYFVKK